MTYWTCGSGRIELEFKPEDIVHVCRSGQNDTYVEDVVRLPRVKKQLDKLDPDLVRGVLREYGAWDKNELRDHVRNLRRLVWVALWDCMEEQDDGL